MKPRPFIRLSESVLDAQITARQMPPSDGSRLRYRACQLAAKHYPPQWMLDGNFPGINICALALSLPRLTVHRLFPASVSLIHETDIRSMPAIAPRLMESGFIVEVADIHTERLFGNVVSLGGYSINGEWFLLSQTYPDGMLVMPWTPRFDPVAQPADGFGGKPNLIPREQVAKALALSSDAARFVITLALLLDAAGSPLEMDGDVQRAGAIGGMTGKRLREELGRHAVGWSIQTVTIPAGYHPAPERDPEGGEGLSAEDRGLTPVDTPIRGYLRHYNSEWKYVAPYRAIRYRSEKPTRVLVHRKLEGRRGPEDE